jgi:hypothetical protein
MKASIHDRIRQRLLQRAGLAEAPAPSYRFEDLVRTEWSSRFEGLMRNRLIMGALRYGRLRAPGKPQYDRVGSMIRRLSQYRERGNMELLVDVANLCLLEFEECHHPLKHFRSVDGDEREGVRRV